MTGLLKRGEYEPLKAAVHGVAAGLCVAMGLYNGAAFVYRSAHGDGAHRNRHLAMNCALYLLAAVWETRQAARHVDRI